MMFAKPIFKFLKELCTGKSYDEVVHISRNNHHKGFKGAMLIKFCCKKPYYMNPNPVKREIN